MDLSNSSFIVETAQGNVVVNPSSTQSYKNITFAGNGYYDWGRLIAQNLAYVADQLANLSDGGVQQATFDANQFIAQFQASQTQALNDHTTNLLLAIDNKIATKFAVVNSDLTTSLTVINNHFVSIESDYKAADVVLDLKIRDDLNLAINNKTGIVQSNLDLLDNSFTTFRDDTQLWRSTVQPLISSFSSNFEVFQSNTEADLILIHSDIIANYDNLNNKIITINSNVVGNNAAVLADANLYTDGQISNLSSTVLANKNAIQAAELALENRVSANESDISVIQGLVPSFITTSNTILTDSKNYTNTEVAKISGPTGSLTNLIGTVQTLDTGISGRIHAIADPINTTLGGNLSALDTLTHNYINSNDSVVSNNNNDMLSKNTAVTGRLSIIESTYPGIWENDATIKTGIVQDFANGLDTRLTGAETDIDNIQTTLLTISGTASGASSDLTILIPRVTALENTRATTTDMIAADTVVLNSAKTYTDGKVTTLNTTISTGNTNTLNSAKAYTDSKTSALALTIPNKTNTDAAVSLVGILSSQMDNINTNTIPSLTDGLNTLSINTTKLGTDIRGEYNSKIDSLSYSLSQNINFIKENFVTYDTIYPILKTILGFIINNQITQTELNDLIDGIMLQYKNENLEMVQSNINGAVFMTASNYNVRLILNKETYRNGIVSINFSDGSISKTITSFESNTSGNVLPLYNNANFLMAPASDVVNNSVQFNSGLNINNLVATITYKNEFGFDASEKYNVNMLFNSNPFTFRDLYWNTVSGKLELYLEVFGPATDITNITQILADGNILTDNTDYVISSQIIFDGYYSKKIKIILSDANKYKDNSISSKIESITIIGNSTNFGTQDIIINIQDLLKYSVGGTN